MAVRIEYRLDDDGWADCDLAIGSSTTTVEASYIGDALRELVEATLASVILTATRAVLDTHGLQGYREKWRHEFPWDTVYRLDNALQRANI